MTHQAESKNASVYPMRLAMITQDFPPEIGGIQTYAHELARRMAGHTAKFEVVAPYKADAEDYNRDYPVRRLRSSNALLPWKALLELPRWIGRHNWDALFHAQWQGVPAALWARRHGWQGQIWVAAHARELLFNPYGSIPGLGRLYENLRFRMLKQVDHFFPVSSYTAGLLTNLGVDEQRITVIHNGTSTERFYPMDVAGLRDELQLDGRKVLMTTSRLVGRKGIDTVIEAMPRLLLQHPDAHYFVLGDGPDRSRLQDRIDELNLGAHVTLKGPVDYDDLVRYYNLCDVFVMPSRADGADVEGFGLVFLEANACGKPVVGSRTGGIPDAIVNGETGLLVEPDQPDELADTLSRLLNDTEKMEALGRQGLRRVREQSTWDHIADKMLCEMFKLHQANQKSAFPSALKKY